MGSKDEKKLKELKKQVKPLKKKTDKIEKKLKDEKEQKKALAKKLAKELKKKLKKDKKHKDEKKAEKKAEKAAKKQKELLKKADKLKGKIHEKSSEVENIKEKSLDIQNASKGEESVENYIEKELVCINCPIGCLVSVKGDTNDVDSLEISGNKCCRGKKYAKSEILNPTRMVTSSIKVIGGDKELVSVKTENPIPKDLIFKVMEEIREASVEAPVTIGDVLIKDVSGTGISVVATSKAKAH